MPLSPRSDPHHPGDASENPLTLTLHRRRRGSKGSGDAEMLRELFCTEVAPWRGLDDGHDGHEDTRASYLFGL